MRLLHFLGLMSLLHDSNSLEILVSAVVVEVRVKEGQEVKAGDPLLVLS